MPSTVVTTTFTGFNLEDARAKVLRKLRQIDTVRYSPTKGVADYAWIDDCLRSAGQTFTMKSKCLRTFAILQLKAGYRTYRAPQGFIDIAAAYFYYASYENGYEKLTIKSIAELNQEYSDWRTAEGEEATILYVDRSHGTDSVIGVYPIPSVDGTAKVFASDTADEYVWACPLYANSSDYGEFIYADGVSTFILPGTNNVVTADLEVTPGNILLEYYRLPMDLLESEQMMEIPYAYQDTVIDMAVAELLENNPEDSNESKRSLRLDQKSAQVMQDYKKEAKPPLTGRNLRAMTAVEGFLKNMEFRRRQY
jgi:hypothetical protein